MTVLRKIGGWLAVIVWIAVCGEVVIRAISAFTMVYSVEMLNYAKELKVRSDNPVLTHQHRTNASAELMGVEVSLNSLGHRGPELANPKPAGEKRIFVLGSSFTLGWGVGAGEVFADVLAQRLNAQKSPATGHRYVTANAGVGNYNSVFEVELFKQQVDAVKPDLVVIQYYINDAEPNPVASDNAIFRYSLAAAFLYQQVRSLTTLDAMTLEDYYAGLYEDGQPGWEGAKAALAELEALTAARGIPLVATLIPELHDLSPDGPYPPIYARIAGFFASIGVPLIDTFPAIAARFADDPPSAWVALDDPHPNALVHAIVADRLAQYLIELEF